MEIIFPILGNNFVIFPVFVIMIGVVRILD